MLGSKRQCTNCHGTSLQRVMANRTIQCKSCSLILEEIGMNDLQEYQAFTQTEEVFGAIAPDHYRRNIVDDIPSDPYCTPGFISGFRMLSPLQEPTFTASARTMSGALAEMERVIGDTLFTGYVGYNGRAPGNTVKREDTMEVGERHKSGGDARHTLVAYFEIIELASILCVDKETSNLAIQTFRHTANNTSLRNRNVESLATAAFVSAAQRRWQEYQEWLRTNNLSPSQEEPQTSQESAAEPAASLDTGRERRWPMPPRQLTVEEISEAANLDTAEVNRYLKVVNIALRKQRPENSASFTTHMPAFCERLELPARARRLAIEIAEEAIKQNICSRRNPASISAAAIYLACQLDGIRKTQTEICRATSLTEVTLRKVFKELSREQTVLIPEWYTTEISEVVPGVIPERPCARPLNRIASHRSSDDKADRSRKVSEASSRSRVSTEPVTSIVDLVPPPLPPGFGQPRTRITAESLPMLSPSPLPVLAGASLPQAESPSNPMGEMMSNPTMLAFAKAMTMMPQFMPPPPPPLPVPEPPPLPPGFGASSHSQGQAQKTDNPDQQNAPDPGLSSGDPADASESTAPSAGGVNAAAPSPPPATSQIPAVTSSQAPGDMMAGMRSVMDMMRAMQAFQAIQSQAASSQNSDPASGQMNPFAMMALAIAQTQSGGEFASLDSAAPNSDARRTSPGADVGRESLQSGEHVNQEGVSGDPEKGK